MSFIRRLEQNKNSDVMAILQAHIIFLFFILKNNIAIASHSGTYTATTYTQLTDKHAKIVLKLTTKVTEGHRLQSLLHHNIFSFTLIKLTSNRLN